MSQVDTPTAPRRARTSCFARRIAILAVTALLVVCDSPAPAADDAAPKADTSRAARDEAVRAIPFDKLPREARAKVSHVLQKTSLYRRLPTQTIDCDADLYAYLLNHPEIVVNIWQTMGITRMTMQPAEGGIYHISDGEGTTGRMEYLYTSPELSIIYSEGSYDGRLYPRTVRGRCLMLLRTKYQRDRTGGVVVTSRLDTFLAVENLGVEIIAKTFQPVIGNAADHNFIETARFVSTLSKTAETNPQGMVRLAQRLKRLEPQTRQRFAELVAAVPRKRNQGEVEQASAVSNVTSAIVDR
jgi:hypothetical protein